MAWTIVGLLVATLAFPLAGSATGGAPARADAFGVSASVGATYLVGPNPSVDVQTYGGRTDQEAYAAKLWVRGLDGSELARVDGLRDVVAANAQRFGNHSSIQARAFSEVAYVSLLNGQVTARGLFASVFSSNGARLDGSASRIAELTVLGVDVSVQGSATIPLAGLGTLYVNETITDASRGDIVVHALRLELAGGIEVIVGSAEAQTQAASAVAGNCRTWTEAYPVGTNSLVLSQNLGTRHWAVIGDPGGQGIARGSVYAADVVDPLPTIVQLKALGAWDAMATGGTTGSAIAASLVLDANLLNGLVTAHVLEAASTTSAGNGPQVSDAGTYLADVQVNGVHVPVTAPPNSVNVTLALNGQTIGYVLVNEQTRIATHNATTDVALVRINMLHVVLTTRALGLAAGTELVVGHAVAVSACGLSGPLPLDFGDPLGLRK
jgi:hypothetical protein